jgi:endonuclease YncB( thermonuclease family)
LLAALIFAAGLLAGGAIGSAASTQGRMPAAATAAPVRPGYPADILRVIDGDTFEARVRAWPGLDVTTKVRLRGIDAPELRAVCAEERRTAEAARERLQAMLARGRVAIADVSLDKYGGRVVASVSTVDVADVAAALIEAGLARSYAGGGRVGWCGSAPADGNRQASSRPNQR